MKRAALAACALLAACSYWQPTDETPLWQDPDGRYTVEFPRGWLRQKGPTDMLWLTRNGFALEQIVVFRRPLDKAFPRSKRKADALMLPHELAQRQLAEFKRESEVLAAAQVETLEPAQVGGRDGFRLVLTWRNDDGLPLGRVIYGVADARHYYMLGFEAPMLHYYDKHLPDFEALRQSFRLTGTRAGD